MPPGPDPFGGEDMRVLIPRNHPCSAVLLQSWDRALMGLENEPGQFGPVELDPTQPPPTHLRQAAASSLCCPLIGCAAVWHSLQVSHAWGQGHHNR